jgi:hypothetical protein
LRILIFLETFRLPFVNFSDELPSFSKPRWITHLQISHGTRQYAYLSKDTKLEVWWCRIFLWIPHQVPKHWLILMAQKLVIHWSKPNILSIIRFIWSTTFFMPNLRCNLLSLSREKSCLTKSGTFHEGWSILFWKPGISKKRQLFGFFHWRTSGTHGVCIDRAQKAKYSSWKERFVHSYTWHRVKSVLYTKTKVKSEQQ